MTTGTLLLLVSLVYIVFQNLLFKSVHSHRYPHSSFTYCHHRLLCLFLLSLSCLFLSLLIKVSSSELLFSQFQIIMIHILHYTLLKILISISTDLELLFSAIRNKVNKNKLVKVFFLLFFQALF